MSTVQATACLSGLEQTLRRHSAARQVPVITNAVMHSRLDGVMVLFCLTQPQNHLRSYHAASLTTNPKG